MQQNSPFKSTWLWVILLGICFAPLNSARGQVLISLLFGDKLNSDKLFFGLHVNYTRSTLTNLEGAESVGGLKAALMFNFRLGDRFYLQTELMPPFKFGAKGLAPYSLNDAALDSVFAGGEVEKQIQLMGITALAQYRVWDYLRVEAGPELFLRTKATDIFTTETSSGDLKLERDAKDETAAIEAGLALGLTYQLQKGTGMFLGFRYYWGLTDVLTEVSDDQQFRMWQITSGIPIGRGKKTKENANPATE